MESSGLMKRKKAGKGKVGKEAPVRSRRRAVLSCSVERGGSVRGEEQVYRTVTHDSRGGNAATSPSTRRKGPLARPARKRGIEGRPPKRFDVQEKGGPNVALTWEVLCHPDQKGRGSEKETSQKKKWAGKEIEKKKGNLFRLFSRRTGGPSPRLSSVLGGGGRKFAGG